MEGLEAENYFVIGRVGNRIFLGYGIVDPERNYILKKKYRGEDNLATFN